MQFYARQRTLPDVITVAALARTKSGKRHPHQYRIPRLVLERAREALQIADLRQATDFDDLYDRVNQAVIRIRGVGDLTVYDTAQRIGAYLGFEPTSIYLHDGTRKGAAALGLRGTRLRREQLPPELQVLTPAQIEDCLCIFKEQLARIWRQ